MFPKNKQAEATRSETKAEPESESEACEDEFKRLKSFAN